MNKLKCPYSNSGQIQLPLTLAFSAFAFLLLGTYGVARHWRHAVELQYRLDHCVARHAIRLRQTQRLIEKTNWGIETARILAGAGTLYPPVRAAALQINDALVLIQIILLRSWDFTRMKWLARRGCDGEWKDWAKPLPKLRWIRDPPDPLGKNALEWERGISKKLRISIDRSRRASRALIYYDETETETFKPKWKSIWNNPRTLSNPEPENPGKHSSK